MILTIFYSPFVDAIAEQPTVEADSEMILCYGDSLTYGWGKTEGSKSYPGVLASCLNGQGFKVENMGVGGETAMAIGIRQGGMPMYVKPFTVPAGTDAVAIELFSPSNYVFEKSLVHQWNVALNPVTIGGISGSIYYDSKNTTYIFIRSSSGMEAVFTRPEKVVTFGSSLTGKCLCIWIGTNDIAPGVENIIINVAENMIRHNGNDAYIIIGLTASNDIVPDANHALANHFGNHFIDIRSYLLSYGLADAQITPTEQDIKDIDNGAVPASLRIDAVHFNDAGYAIIGNQVYRKGIELGYWK